MRCGVVPKIWPNLLVDRMSCVRCCGVRVLVVGGGTGKTILVERAMADSGGLLKQMIGREEAGQGMERQIQAREAAVLY